MGCCCSKTKTAQVKSQKQNSSEDNINQRQPMTIISPMVSNHTEEITTKIPFSSSSPKEEHIYPPQSPPISGRSTSGIKFEDLKNHDLKTALEEPDNGIMPYANGVDDTGIDDSPASMTSSQARNLGPLIAARMKRETASSQLKKTVGITREVGLKSSVSGINAFNRSTVLGPESRVGYMLKQGQRLRNFKKSYFILSNGVLMDFETEMDSLNNSKISERSDKTIYLKGYKLISIQNKNQLILELDEVLTSQQMNQNTTIDDMGRDSMDMIQIGKQRNKYVFEIKDHTQYLLWQNAFQSHLNFANRAN